MRLIVLLLVAVVEDTNNKKKKMDFRCQEVEQSGMAFNCYIFVYFEFFSFLSSVNCKMLLACMICKMCLNYINCSGDCYFVLVNPKDSDVQTKPLIQVFSN